jgi:hypothetical protein
LELGLILKPRTIKKFKNKNLKANFLFYLCAEPKLKLESKHIFEGKK